MWSFQCLNRRVTPYAGVWIEISIYWCLSGLFLSLPTRECGLKSSRITSQYLTDVVTPYAGVWIEIELIEELKEDIAGHSLRGSVD